MAEKLSTSELPTTQKLFDPVASMYELPENVEPDYEIEEEVDNEEPLEAEEESPEYGPTDDLLGKFVVSEEDEFDEQVVSSSIPDEADENKDETKQPGTQFESLKEAVGEKVGGASDSIVSGVKATGDAFKDQAKGVVRGVGEAGIRTNDVLGFSYLYGVTDNKLNELGVGSEYSAEWNIKGTKNYDPTKPLLQFNKNSENPTFERGYWSSGQFLLEEPSSAAGQIIKPITSFVVVMAATRGLVGYSAPATLGARAAEDALIGTMAFNPDGKRTYEYFTDLIGEIPIESDVGIKIANYLRSDSEDPEYLKQIKVAADSVLMEVGLSKLGGVLVLAAQTVKRFKGKTDKEILAEKLADMGIKDVHKYMEGTTESQEKAIKELQAIAKANEGSAKKAANTPKRVLLNPATPSDKLLSEAITWGDTDLITALKAYNNNDVAHTTRLLNINNVNDVGLTHVLDMISAVHLRHGGFAKATSKTGIIKKKALGGGIQGSDEFGKPTSLVRSTDGTSVTEEGLAIVDEIKGVTDTPFTEFMATMTGQTVGDLKKLMMKDFDNVHQLESRMFAYKVLLRELSMDLASKLNVMDLTNPQHRELFKQQMMEVQDLITLRGNIRGTAARTITAEQIPLPQKWLETDGSMKNLEGDQKLARDAFLDEQLNGDGITPEFADYLRTEVFGKTDDPLEALKWALKGFKSIKENTYEVFLEAYRSNLLSNLNVFQTAVVSGTIETFYGPLRDILGNLGDAGIKTITGKKSDFSMLIRSKHRMVGIYKSYWTATKNALKALKDEKNILDPYRSVVDRDKNATDVINKYAIQAQKKTMENNATKWLGHLWNITGKGVRLPTRVLGSIDEFLKQINYNSWVYSEMMENMSPAIKNSTDIEKKAWVKSQHSKYFDANGRATNEKGLNFARKQIFQEDLISSGMDKNLQRLSKKVYLEPFIPIVRTPSNIVKRVMTRSFAPFRLLQEDVRRKWNGSPELRAEILGDTVIAGGMLTATWDLIGSGRVTGAGPRDPSRRKLWEDAGFEPYSIRVGDKWHRYDRFAPATASLMMVANVYENSWEFNNRKDEVGLAMIMGFIQSIGDMHFIGSFFDLMDGITEMYRTGEIATSLIDKGILTNPVIPKYVTQISHGIQAFGAEEEEHTVAMKNSNTVMENFSKDVATLRGTNKEGDSIYDELGGDEWNWLTGEKVTLPANHWSYLIGKPAPEEYDPVFQELVRMDLHLSAPQRYIAQLDITLTPNEMTKYQQLMGTSKHMVRGKKRTLYETLELLMYSDRYKYDPRRQYPNNPGVRNWRVEKMQQIVQKFKSAAFKQLLQASPELKEHWIERKTAQHKLVRASDNPQKLKGKLRSGFLGNEKEEEGEWGSILGNLIPGSANMLGPRP
jgi:hypothetical protein